MNQEITRTYLYAQRSLNWKAKGGHRKCVGVAGRQELSQSLFQRSNLQEWRSSVYAAREVSWGALFFHTIQCMSHYIHGPSMVIGEGCWTNKGDLRAKLAGHRGDFFVIRRNNNSIETPTLQCRFNRIGNDRLTVKCADVFPRDPLASASRGDDGDRRTHLAPLLATPA